MKLTLKEYIETHGAEKTAHKLIDQRILALCGLSILDLPDTCVLADIMEELADVLQDNPNDKEAINEVLRQIDFEFIEELVMY